MIMVSGRLKVTLLCNFTLGLRRKKPLALPKKEHVDSRNESEQDSIPVGCVPPACCPYLPACTGLGMPAQGVCLPAQWVPAWWACLTGGGGYHVTYPIMHLMLPVCCLHTNWDTSTVHLLIYCCLVMWPARHAGITPTPLLTDRHL